MHRYVALYGTRCKKGSQWLVVAFDLQSGRVRKTYGRFCIGDHHIPATIADRSQRKMTHAGSMGLQQEADGIASVVERSGNMLEIFLYGNCWES